MFGDGVVAVLAQQRRQGKPRMPRQMRERCTVLLIDEHGQCGGHQLPRQHRRVRVE
jgi:hypothetical protein